MAADSADRSRLAMGAIVTATVDLRSCWLGSPSRSQPRQWPPNSRLPGWTSLTPYLAPVPDTAHLVLAGVDSMVGGLDPFATVVGTRSERTAAPEPEEVSDSTWVVYGVAISAQYRSAFINESLVKLGEEFDGGVRLTAVERNYVVLTDSKGRRHTIAVSGGGERLKPITRMRSARGGLVRLAATVLGAWTLAESAACASAATPPPQAKTNVAFAPLPPRVEVSSGVRGAARSRRGSAPRARPRRRRGCATVLTADRSGHQRAGISPKPSEISSTKYGLNLQSRSGRSWLGHVERERADPRPGRQRHREAEPALPMR